MKSENQDLKRSLIAALLLSVLLAALIVWLAVDTSAQIQILERDLDFAEEVINQQVPDCSEDTVFLGAGDYEDGRWDYLICGPAVDDYAREGA